MRPRPAFTRPSPPPGIYRVSALGRLRTGTDPFGSSVRRLPPERSKEYRGAVILLEIGLVVAILAFFAILDLYVRGCEKL